MAALFHDAYRPAGTVYGFNFIYTRFLEKLNFGERETYILLYNIYITGEKKFCKAAIADPLLLFAKINTESASLRMLRFCFCSGIEKDEHPKSNKAF